MEYSPSVLIARSCGIEGKGKKRVSIRGSTAWKREPETRKSGDEERNEPDKQTTAQVGVVDPSRSKLE